MDRRKFFAYLPGLSAIPLIGREIIKDEEKITIIKPEPIQVVKEMPTFAGDLRRLRLILTQDGVPIGEGYVSSMTSHFPFSQRRDSDWVTGLHEITVDGIIYQLNGLTN